MKKKTLLSVLLAILMAVPVSAEIRIYFAYGKHRNIDLPGEADYQFDARFDDNQVKGWIEGGSGPGDGSGGTFFEYWTNGGAPFKYSFSVLEGHTLDLSGVTGDWVLHMDTRFWQSNCDLNVTFYDNEGTEYTFMMPQDSYVVDYWGWNAIDIDMYNFIDLGFDPAKAIYDNQIFFSFGSVGDVEGTGIGFNDIYLTDYDEVENPEEFEVWKGGEDTGVASVKEDKGIALAMGNGLLKVINNPQKGFTIYSVCGSVALESQEDIASIEALAPGIYIVKAGNKSAKFVKK